MLICFILKPHLTSVVPPDEGHRCEQETLPCDDQTEVPPTLPAHRLILTGLAEVPSHIHSDNVSLPSVVGIYQVAEGDSEGDS